MYKKLLSLLLILLFTVTVLAACTSGDTPEDSGRNSTEQTGADLTEGNLDEPAERTIVDMAGRTVVVPASVSSGLGTGAVGTYMLYTMDPASLVGVNYEFNDLEKAYILEEYHDLPAFGQGNSLNLEAIIAAAPDVLIVYSGLSDATGSDADDMQQQTGIPCIVLSQELADIPAAYRLLGEVFGQQERCEALAQYAEQALAFAAAIDIPAEDWVSVYYGNGVENLETAPQGSSHAELLQVVPAHNVAVLPGEISTRIDVSAEQVIAWNPQVVILNGEPTDNVSPTDAVASFLEDSRYANLQAVQDGHVYAIPKYPYSWFDRPSGPNRLIGIYWLSELLYPDNFDIDIKAEAREFYELYYHMQLSDQQLTDLLGF